jgi:hypothetical protein
MMDLKARSLYKIGFASGLFVSFSSLSPIPTFAPSPLMASAGNRNDLESYANGSVEMNLHTAVG